MGHPALQLTIASRLAMVCWPGGNNGSRASATAGSLRAMLLMAFALTTNDSGVGDSVSPRRAYRSRAPRSMPALVNACIARDMLSSEPAIPLR